jgi:hypothetical protein
MGLARTLWEVIWVIKASRFCFVLFWVFLIENNSSTGIQVSVEW